MRPTVCVGAASSPVVWYKEKGWMLDLCVPLLVPSAVCSEIDTRGNGVALGLWEIGSKASTHNASYTNVWSCLDCFYFQQLRLSSVTWIAQLAPPSVVHQKLLITFWDFDSISDQTIISGQKADESESGIEKSETSYRLLWNSRLGTEIITLH